MSSEFFVTRFQRVRCYLLQLNMLYVIGLPGESLSFSLLIPSRLQSLQYGQTWPKLQLENVQMLLVWVLELHFT